MVKIGLFCAAGFSTGMLVNNMEHPQKMSIELPIV
ncbi:PTS system sugar-specific transporter subunit EIIB [Streptococcus pneumoniae]|nr:PTS system sugar-specific transporter subunit EIIB [Streptococcus pneumoniae]